MQVSTLISTLSLYDKISSVDSFVIHIILYPALINLARDIFIQTANLLNFNSQFFNSWIGSMVEVCTVWEL